MSDFINPQLHESLIRKLVANSRAIISYQVGISIGCVRMDRILVGLAQFKKLEYPVFREYLDATRHLPYGSERLYWNRNSLKNADEQLVAINLQYREKIIDSCFDIIEKHKTMT